MTPEEMKKRLAAFALRILRLAEALPRTRSGNLVAGQIGRAGTSVGANYRAACRARSTAEFVAKLGIVEEETDECLYWLELSVGAGMLRQEDVADLLREGNEILSMIVSSITTARGGPRANARHESRQSAIRNPQSTIGRGKA